MRVSIEATQRDLKPSLTWLSSHIGRELNQRMATFDKSAEQNPMLAAYFSDNFRLEHAFAKANKYRRSTNRVPKGPEYDALYAFAIPAWRMYAQLPEAARKPFVGKLHDFVNGTFGARPFSYEIAIASHLMQKGFDVEFADLTGTARFDFLARAGTLEFEVECKTTSGDKGRKIHRQELNRLADLLVPTTSRLADKAGCHLISLTIPDRLNASSLGLAELAAIVDSAVQTGETISSQGRARYWQDPITAWPNPAEHPDARAFFERRLGAENSHLLFHSRAGFSIVAVRIASDVPDRVIAALSREAKDAAKQCSGTRPAIVCMQIIDPIEPVELARMLHTSNGLHKIAHAIFKDEARAHVDSIVFTPPARMERRSRTEQRMLGSALVLHNDKRKFDIEGVRSVFGMRRK